MERDVFRHGFAESDWNSAKDEARQNMYQIVSRRDTISYSSLVDRIDSVSLDAHDPRLAHFLGQIAREDDENGLGLTTVVVVHKHGDGQPGPGFFEMAESQGRVVSDSTTFWIDELKRVHDHWAAQ